jgi:hypothetical protein
MRTKLTCVSAISALLLGATVLPADETQTDLGHNTHWGGYEGIAADITAWITGAAPTKERTYANPGGAGSVLTETGTAVIIEWWLTHECGRPSSLPRVSPGRSSP